MYAYYNEIDPFAAAWLRELIKAGHIAPGEVDERSITDVEPADLKGFTQCHFFAGIGVWSYTLRQAGWPDDRPVWTGSCPCQPFSSAGKGKGFADERHLWPDFSRLISQCRPSVCFGEQVASKDGLAWLDLVQADMENAGYAFGAVDACAAGFGAPHIRQRIYWVADTYSQRRTWEWVLLWEEETGRNEEHLSKASGSGEIMFHRGCTDTNNGTCPVNGFWGDADWILCRDGKWRAVEPCTFPLAHGSPARVGRLRGYGNAIVAPQAKAFIEAYLEIGA